MTPIPEAIEKHYRYDHWLLCAECGLVNFAHSSDYTIVRREFDAAWKQHLDEKHSERKP